MRRFLLAMVLLLVATGVQAHKKAYCRIIVTSVGLTSNKVTISIDFGQESRNFDNDTLVDANGEPIEFNSTIDALNYLGSKGWDFEQAYQIPSHLKDQPPTCYYLLSKSIDDETEDNFVTKAQYRAAHKKKKGE